MRQRGRGGGGRGVATYHTPSIPKSRGRLAPRQIAVASTPRASQRRSGKRRKARSLSRKWQKIIAATATAAARVLRLQRGPPPLGKKRSSRKPHRSSLPTNRTYVSVIRSEIDRPTDRPPSERSEEAMRRGLNATRTNHEDPERRRRVPDDDRDQRRHRHRITIGGRCSAFRAVPVTSVTWSPISQPSPLP